MNKDVFSVFLISIFSQTFLSASQHKTEILYEKRFDAEIEEVVFSSYEEKGKLNFYPKVVILKHLDTELSEGDYKYYKREVQLLNSDGTMRKSLWFPHWSKVGCSNDGNYFYVWTDIPEKPEPYDAKKLILPETKTKASSLAVYNDKGEMLWKKSPYEMPYETYGAPWPIISPRDGSVIKSGDVFYGKSGIEKPISAVDLYGYDFYELHGFNENWEFAVALSRKSPTQRNRQPLVLFVDSLLNLMWERSLDEYTGYGAIISPDGSYIYASGYTTAYQKTAVRHGGIVSATGYLFDRYGNLIMKIENGSYPKAFSKNESYLLINFNTPNKSLVHKMGLIDIKAKKILFKKKFRIGQGVIASDGSVAITRLFEPEVDRNQLKKLPVGEARKIATQLYEQAKLRFYAFDKTGNMMFESEEFESKGGKNAYQILNWDCKILTIGVIDKVQKIVKILQIPN